MSGLMLCSRQADKPYHIDEFGINIYSIEEMAYYLYNNVYFVDRGFFCERLIEYIRHEFNMPQIAGQLEKSIKFGNSYAELVMLIVKASDYYSDEEIKELEYILGKIGNKSVDERMIIRADICMKKGKYASAFKIYKDIIDRKNRIKASDESMANLWYNMGIIHAKRFSYISAAECFSESCSYKREDTAVERLLISYMLAGENQKAAEAAGIYKVTDENVERIRLRISECRSNIMASPEYERFSRALSYDGKINLEEFYEKLQDIIDGWKEEYREEMT